MTTSSYLDITISSGYLITTPNWRYVISLCWYKQVRSLCQSHYIHSSKLNVLVVVICRPSYAVITNIFFVDFEDMLHCTEAYTSSLMILGDVNIHLDVEEKPNTVKFRQTLDNHNVVLHVTGTTHISGHTLDVVIVKSDMLVSDVFVDDTVMWDHSFITIVLALGIIKIELIATVIQRRRWHDFNQ